MADDQSPRTLSAAHPISNVENQMPAPASSSPPRPLVLTDSQLTEIMRLSAPLQPAARDALLRILAHEFNGRRDGVGDGELFRLVRETIKSYRLFDPPIIERVPSRWDRDRPSFEKASRRAY